MINLFRKNNFVKSIKQFMLLTVIVSFFASCVSTKNVTYFQGDDLLDTVRYSVLTPISPVVPTIQVDDILSVTVSSLSEETNELFNRANITPLHTVNFPGVSGFGRTQPLGYLVDPNGFLEMPLIGKVKVAGLNADAAADIIKQELMKFVKNPSISVRFLSQKFTILGEVNRPGIYNLLSDRVTLPEVLGTAGDLTIFGKRDNVMLIRTYENGKREVVKINLNSRKVLDSPYYFMKNNDVIYVEPTAGRITSSDRTLQLIPIVTGITTTLVLLVNFLFK